MFRMIELENYKSNLDIIDTYGVKDIKINKAVVYTGNTQYINEQLKKVVHNSPLHAAAVIGMDNTAIPIPEKSKFFDIWTDTDAQEIFIDNKPTCYLIVGKDGMGAFALGEEISKKLDCVHLNPQTIILDEIEQNSPTGRAWDFNMRHNRPCTYEMILKMLKIKMNSPAVKHRGYVLSEFPLITCNVNPLYYFSSFYSEEAFQDVDDLVFDIICNLKKKKPRKPPESPSQSVPSLSLGEEEDEEEEDDEGGEKQEEEEEAAEEDPPAELPKFILDSCSGIVVKRKSYYLAKQAALAEQMRSLFNFSMKPDIIIHVTCPDLDLLTKKTHKYINYLSGQYAVEPFYREEDPNLRWPPKGPKLYYDDPAANVDFDYKYNCKPPTHFPDRAISQICNYKKYMFPYLEKKLKDYNPNKIIELDGRTSTFQMIHHISERLLLLHIQPVIIPEPLYLDEIPEENEEFWEIVSETKIISSGAITFRYYPSLLFNRCPVELKRRRSVVGNPRYAVMFFRHVYLMANLENFVLFCRNPRPFLKLKYLEPTCRIIIIGTRSSGKSMIAECLSWIFETPIIDYKAFVENIKQKKYETFAKSILSELVAPIEDSRLQKWQKAESDRTTQLNLWCDSALKLLNEYLQCLVKYKEKELSEVPAQDDKEDVENEIKSKDLDTLMLRLNELKNRLSFLSPILDSVEECEKVIADKSISQYAPDELITEIKKPSLPVLRDDDVKEAVSEYIVNNNLQKEIEPTTEDIMPEIINVLSEIDTKHKEETNSDEWYGKYIIDGFPSDSAFWGYFHDPKLLPDYTIALIENKEIDQELYQHYVNVEKYTKNYEEKVLASKDPLIVTRLNQIQPSDLKESDIEILVIYLINMALDFIFITNVTNTSNIQDEDKTATQTESPEDVENAQNDGFAPFSEAIEKFREDWDSIKVKLEEKSKVHIEVELHNKSDVEIIDEVLLRIRQGYYATGETYEEEEDVYDEYEDDETPKDLLTYNDSQFYCETNIYCPIAYRDYNILWEGKPEFCLKLDNKVHKFSKEEFLDTFRKNVTFYQSLNIPFKKLPTLKICIIGSIGSGVTTLSKSIAKELGLLHINFPDIINNYMMPRHFKNVGRNYENLFTDELLDEEGVVEFQMDEENVNLISDILSNEAEMRRMLNNYLERGTPILSVLMQKLIKKIWFEPFVPTGFVLDGYPRIASDVEDMFACFCIPDLVIELESNSVVAVQRLAPIMFNKWKSQQNEAKQVAKHKLDIEKKEWLHNITKQIVTKLIIEEIFDKMFFSAAPPEKALSAESVIMDAHPTGSTNVDPALFSAYNEMLELYPEPVDTSVWESADDAHERIESRIEGICEMDEENIASLKEGLLDQKIKVLTIDGTKSKDKVFRITLSKLTKLRNRCESLFEQTFIVSPEIADLLLKRARRVPVPDERYDYLCEYHKPASKVPAFLNVVDIAGLVRGAAEGQGLGNAFLSHIKACDAIFNLCRAFDDEDVIHVDGDVNPVRDLETIGEELRLKDEEQLMQNFEKLDRVVNRGGDKKLKPEYDALTRIKTVLVDEKKHIRFGDWSAADIEVLNKYLFLTSKPALYLVNLSEKDYIRKKNKWLPKLKEWIDKNDPGAPLIPFSGVLENKLMEMDPAERQAFLKEHNITSALDKIIVQGYKALQLEYFFTAGPDEVKAWTIQKGTKAPQAAGRIHTDFEKGFIMAEVMHFKDFKEEGSEAACKAAGKYRQQGRNYVVEDGDIIFFKFNAGAGLKDAKKK